MPGSDAPRKREDTSWPEHADRVLSSAERQRRHKAKKAGKDPDTVVPKRSGLPAPTPAPAESEPPEIPADPDGPEPEDTQDRSVRDAVAASVAHWGKSRDPLAEVALGLAKVFDRCVKDNSPSAATVADRLTATLDRLRPTSGSAPAASAEAKVSDPATLVERRKKRLAEAAKDR